MPRNVIKPIPQYAEPMLGEVALQPVTIEPVRKPVRNTWLPEVARIEPALDTTLWLTRAARGYSWNRGSRSNKRPH
jgi:hypothetical protein